MLSFNDFPCNDDYTITVESGNATVNGDIVTLPMSGSATLRLTFTAYPEVYRVFNFEVISKVFDYDPNAEFYRFGTVNEVPIKYVEGVDASKFTITGVPFTVQNVDASVDVNNEKTALQFSGGGKITVQAKAGNVVLDSFVVQVIPDAINISNSNQAFSSSATMCLVEDITRATGSITVGKGCYLYGNGYTITDQNHYTSKNGGFLNLAGTLDNVKIIGQYVDNYYFSSSVTNQDDYYKTVSTVTISTSGAEIHNSYIANGKHAVRLYQMSGSVTISNTSLVGGAISLGVIKTSGVLSVNLHNVKIAQLDNGEFIGAGFAFNEGGEEKVTVNYSGQDNTLQIFATYNMISRFPSDYQAALRTLWNDPKYVKYKYSFNDETYLHAGILALLDDANSMPTFTFSDDCNLANKLSAQPETVSGFSGMVYAFDNTLEGVKNYVDSNISDWLLSKPVHEFNYQPLLPEITVSNNALRGEITSSSQTVNIDELINNNVTATKYGQTLEVKVSIQKISGDGTFDDLFNFTGVGEYNVVYTIVDKFEIDESTSKPVEYSYICTLNIAYKSVPPAIEFTSGTPVNQNGITNPQNIDLSDVDYQIQAEKNGWTFDYNPVYKINVLNDLGLKITAYDGTDITSKAVVKINNKEYGYNEDVELSDGNNNVPGGLEGNNDARYVNVFTISVSVTHEGQTSQSEVKVTFYVEALTGWFDSWGRL